MIVVSHNVLGVAQLDAGLISTSRHVSTTHILNLNLTNAFDLYFAECRLFILALAVGDLVSDVLDWQTLI